MKNLLALLLVALLVSNNYAQILTQAEDEYADKDWWGDDEFSAYNACLAECPTCENTCADEVGDVSTPMAAEESCDWHLENLDADDDEFEGWFFLDWAECMWALSTDTDNFGEEAEEHLYCGAECAWEINWEVEDANWEWDEDEYSDWDEYNEQEYDYEEMMECENFCYETFECDEDCQMDLYDTMEEANGPACREYDALFFDMETGEYTDEEDIEWSPKNMELYEKCMEETEATFVDNFSEFEEMFQCVEACYMDLDSGMGFEEWEENDELEGESDCDDYVCYYEIFECMQECEKTICPNGACIGEEGEKVINDAVESESSCQSVDEQAQVFEEDESAFYTVAPEMFTGEMIKCTDAIREGLEDIDNEYGAKYFACQNECAASAIETNSSGGDSSSQTIAFTAGLLSIVAFLIVV